MHSLIPSYTGKDRILGYSLLLAVFLVFSAVAVYCIHSIYHPYAIRIIAFSEIGNLKQDDPVYVKGLQVGAIKNIVLRPGQVLVCVTLRRPLILFTGYLIKNMEINATGDRILMIDDGNTRSPEIGGADTLKGIFYPGISEALGMAQKMRMTIDSLTVISFSLRNGSPGRASLIFRTRSAMLMLDSLSLSLCRTIGAGGTGILPALDSLSQVLNSIAEVSHKAAVTVPAFLASADTGLRVVDNSMQRMNDLADTLLMVTSAIQKHPLFTKAVPGTVSLRQRIAAMDTVLHTMNAGLLQVKMNLNLW